MWGWTIRVGIMWDVDTGRSQLLPPGVGPELDMKGWTRYQIVELDEKEYCI